MINKVQLRILMAALITSGAAGLQLMAPQTAHASSCPSYTGCIPSNCPTSALAACQAARPGCTVTNAVCTTFFCTVGNPYKKILCYYQQ